MIICDFHIHSKYSRATSSDMEIDCLSKWAKIKGISVLGTGDFTHPVWIKELKIKLKQDENNLFDYNGTKFILTTEVNNIYSKNGRTRRIHNIIFAKDFSVCEKINKELQIFGNLHSDGRPILNLSSEDLVKIILTIDKDCLIVPSHIWTPWFSIFGANSGFDSVEECFGEYSKYIHTLETGLSSDPKMNWRLSSLDKYTLISNSDSHSPSKIGREANVLNCKLSYNEIISTLKNKDKNKFLYTIEFFPEEGKYHYDGHRNCGIIFSPKESKKNKNICPVCQKPLTIGVMHRVENLADRVDGFIPDNAIPYKNLVPLIEIIAEAKNQEVGTQGVVQEYNKLTSKYGNEFDILLKYSESELKENIPEKILDGILKVRDGKIKITPGYDGVYGKIKIFDEEEKNKDQLSLF